MKVGRVSDLSLSEGTFYAVAILSDHECALYRATDANNGTEALEAIREHAKKDESLGALADGTSPVRDVRLVI
jgi:hypothetical protein